MITTILNLNTYLMILTVTSISRSKVCGAKSTNIKMITVCVCVGVLHKFVYMLESKLFMKMNIY